ncbi:MAG TPA: phosphatidylserine decarboxylase, partial [Aggregatilineales bacterium]|nr:phosphatidylserine decarboxylase [Aggregatilineales bacterium]
MRIHREGYQFIAAAGMLLLMLNTCVLSGFGNFPFYISLFVSIIIFIFLTGFFRSPSRETPSVENVIVAPADGKIINIALVREPEYFQDERL